MSARSVAGTRAHGFTKPVVKKRYKGRYRRDDVDESEKAIVAQVVMDSPGSIKESQEKALSTVLRRPREVIQGMIAEARENFVTGAQGYVDIHRQAAEGALAEGEFDTAAKAAQWALENISLEGARVVEKEKVAGPTGPRVLIGIKLGGVDTPVATVPLVKMESVEE